MGIVKYKNPKTGIIYCYESTPKWDPEKGQARPTRTYLGRWDEETQSIIPTNGRRGRPKKQEVPAEGSTIDNSAAELSACREELARCRKELEAVKRENARLLKQCSTFRNIISDIHKRTSAGALE
ncbi:MAG: hypothetical protein J6E40_03750 [Lachnospiraceae bacterium]|nr:hypothetical protein [Lachnospiraceae bacterium]